MITRVPLNSNFMDQKEFHSAEWKDKRKWIIFMTIKVRIGQCNLGLAPRWRFVPFVCKLNNFTERIFVGKQIVCGKLWGTKRAWNCLNWIKILRSRKLISNDSIKLSNRKANPSISIVDLIHCRTLIEFSTLQVAQESSHKHQRQQSKTRILRMTFTFNSTSIYHPRLLSEDLRQFSTLLISSVTNHH